MTWVAPHVWSFTGDSTGAETPSANPTMRHITETVILALLMQVFTAVRTLAAPGVRAFETDGGSLWHLCPWCGDQTVCLRCRERATGDWSGAREIIGEHGLEFNLFATQFFQGAAAGGRANDWEYGGKFDYFVDMDAGRLGLLQGFFLNLHAETRFGSSVNAVDGLLAPANIAMSFPEPDGSVTSITGLKLTQALSERFAIYAGKINTLDEYPIRYLGGPGLGGFMNTSLVFNPIAARTLPYSAVGAGAAILREGEPVFTFTVFDPQERAAEGLSDLYEQGVVLVPDLILRARPFGRPGVYNFGATYSSADYTSVDRSAWLDLPIEPGLFPVETGSWSAYANFYQSLWVDPDDEQRTWGVFGQFGISDGNPNPIGYVANAGIGGRSLLSSRPLDRFGVGFFFVGLSDNFKTLAAPLRPQQNEYGVELFYNYAITPWCLLTGDLQIVEPSTVGYDTASIPGVRLQAIF